MAITATTLSGALTANATVLTVASATGITAPNNQTGTGITILFIDQEFLVVYAVSGTFVSVLRGQFGSHANAHVTGSQVQIGLPTDFPINQEIFNRLLVKAIIGANFNQPAIFIAGSADAVDPTTPGFYVIKSAGVDAITLITPTAPMEGNIIEIYSDTAQAHTVTAATACFAVGVALKTVATFPAFRGAGLRLRVCNLVYHVLSTSGTGTNSGPVVWT